MRFHDTVLLLAALPISIATHGQSAPPSPSAVAMHRIVNQFAGTWSITDQGRDGQIVSGEETWSANASGVPLIEEYHAKSPTGEDLFDVAMIWWDAVGKKYHGRWCADFVDEGCTSFGVSWSDTLVEMTGAYTQAGKPLTWTERFVFDGPSSFTQTLSIGERGGRKKLVSTILATRQKADADGARPPH